MKKREGAVGEDGAMSPTVKWHGTPLFVHVPPNAAQGFLISREVSVTLCTDAPVAGFT